MDQWAVCGQKGTVEGAKFIANADRVSAYGKQIISKGVVAWTIKYTITSGQCCREIGIAQNSDVLHSNIRNQSIIWFGHGSDKPSIYIGKTNVAEASNINNNDILSIELDLNQNKVSFYKNNEQNKIIVDIEPNKSWRLAAHLDVAGQTFTILSFIYKRDIEVAVSLDEVKSVLSNKVMHLNQIDINQLQRMALNDLLNLVQNVDDSQHEFKEIEQSLDEIKQRITSVKAAITSVITPNTSKYQSWNPKDIVRYICVLENGKYADHADVLLNAFTEQCITGSDLLDIEKNDLFTMGVKNFKDRKELYYHFQKLKSKETEGDNYIENID